MTMSLAREWLVNGLSDVTRISGIHRASVRSRRSHRRTDRICDQTSEHIFDTSTEHIYQLTCT